MKDEGLEGIVIEIGIGLGDAKDGTEIIQVNVADSGNAPDVRNYFANACEVISRAASDRSSGGEDGGTLKAASASDTKIVRGDDGKPDTVAASDAEVSDATDVLSDEELERLTQPESEDASAE